MLDAGNFLGSVADLFYQARLAFYTGQTGRAKQFCLRWRQKIDAMAKMADTAKSTTPSGVETSSTPEIPAARGLDVVYSLILLERGQLEEADRLLVETLELLGWGSWMELHGFIELARLRHALGKETQAQEILQRMNRLGPQHAACAEALEILFLAANEFTKDIADSMAASPPDLTARARAKAWTMGYTPDPSYPFALGIGPYHRDTEYICNLAWARVQIALEHFQPAASFISPALQMARERGLHFRVAELSLAQALLHAGQGNPSAALLSLGDALEISQTRGYTRFFDDSPALDRLLQQAVENDIHATYARQLLASFTTRRITPSSIALKSEKSQPGLVDPLSERELEVLRLLATGLSPAEVAKKLYLSPFTLKAHTQNIYSKLDVHSRIEAINRARELGLL
jgi:ATP/maltotriose-dependent transcriptional regulator MalT